MKLSHSKVDAPPPKKKAAVSHVVLIAHYMSGDRNTLASALALDPHLLVGVVGPKDATTEELVDYFAAKAPKRVMILRTKDRKQAEEFLSLVKRPELHKGVFAEVAKMLAIPGEVQFHPPSHATGVIASEFGRRYHNEKDSARAKLTEFWSKKERDGQFADFLARCGFKAQKRYVFLWCKKGTIKGEKAHHYTDRRSWALLAAGIATSNTGFFPVFTGDDIGLATEPGLTEFWKTWQAIYKEPMSRDLQLALWAYIARTMGPHCCAIGMRSGMLEVPALLGIRTLYLEEVENDQRHRMAKWLRLVDTWYRGVMFRPLGTMQNVYWTQQMVKHDSYGAVVARTGSSPKQLHLRMTAETEMMVSIALLYLQTRDLEVYRRAKDLVLDYLGFDVDIAGNAIARHAVGTIVEWLAGRMPFGRGDSDALARSVIKEMLPLAIEGGVQAPVKKVSAKPSPQELERLRLEKEAAKKKKEAEKQGVVVVVQKRPVRAAPPPPPTRYGPGAPKAPVARSAVTPPAPRPTSRPCHAGAGGRIPLR